MSDEIQELVERLRRAQRTTKVGDRFWLLSNAADALERLRRAAPVPAGWVSKYALPLRANAAMPAELWGAKIHDDDVPLYIGPPCPAAAATRTNEVERDAARYRLLRAEADLPPHARLIFVCPPAPAAACASGDELDAAVDAALSERPE